MNPVQPGLCLQGLLATLCVCASEKGFLELALQGRLWTPEPFQPEGQEAWQADTEKLCPLAFKEVKRKQRWEEQREGKRQKDKNSGWKGKKATEIWDRKKDSGDYVLKSKIGVTTLLLLCSHFYTHRIPVNEPRASRHPCLNAFEL